jgi:hypothetical protein
MTRSSNRKWIVWVGIATVVLLGAIGAGAVLLLRSGLTRPFDNLFGDQHLKTTVALVELHRIRYGRYSANL